MNEYEIMIKNLENRVTELEKQLFAEAVKTIEPVKWQPKGGEWYIGYGGGVVKLVTASEGREFGLERQTKEQALRASIEMRMFNRLLALRDELCGDDVVNWSNNATGFYLYISHDQNIWNWSSDERCETITPYFTSKESVQRACDMLNSGEVEL